ncbi:MAG: alpha/beta fold hydrolase, partial [Pseudomonadota bacterium]
MVFPTGPYHPTWDGDGSDWPSRELSQFVTTGGCRFHFQRSIPDAPGTKKLLFLHGTGAATHSWVPTVNLLNNEYECLNLDLPGHGFSRARAAAKPTLPGVADSIAALLYSL